MCLLRDIYRSIRDFELDFQRRYGLCLNEGMALCSLKTGKLSSSDIAAQLGITHSNASKVIKSVEDKGLIERSLGADDKRQMYFILSPEGKTKLEIIKEETASVAALLEQIEEMAGR